MKFKRHTGEKEFKDSLLPEAKLKRQELSRDVRYSISQWFEEYSIYYDRMLITEISSNRIKNGIQVNITLGRPGLLIGKAGSTIATLEKYLEDRFSTNIKIHIVESQMWNYNFKYEEKELKNGK